METKQEQASKIWEQRYKEKETTCTKIPDGTDPIDYTQHPFIYQHAISLPLTGSKEIVPIWNIANTYLVPAKDILSIGCGMGYIEEMFLKEGFAKHITAYELSQNAIDAVRARISNTVYSDSFTFRNIDILKDKTILSEKYDVVFVQAGIHHFMSISEMFDLMYRVLKPNGLLIYDEYIGPDHHLYEDYVMGIINEINNSLEPEFRYDVLSQSIRTEVPKPTIEYMMQMDPSEGVHSSRILPLTYQYFDVIHRCDYGGTIMRPFFVGILPNFDFNDPKDQTVVKLIILIEQLLTRYSIIPHYHTMVVGRKREKPLERIPDSTADRINFSNWGGLRGVGKRPTKSIIRKLFGK